YKIRDHKSEGAPGLISALGVKLTSFRAASKDAVDLVSKKLKSPKKCSTGEESLPGAKGIDNFDDFFSGQTKLLEKAGLDKEQISYLLSLYGARISEQLVLIEKDHSLMEKICQFNPQVLAEVVLSVEKEFALTVSDFMMRRVPLVFSECRGLDCVGSVATKMGQLLGWDEPRVQKEIISYKEEVRSQFSIASNI
ncbi:MAG: hypothetical protein OK457_11210, partial [Thaumarchaeota archaeon]|nr:hypothetical protein [Nitrososphaerota archaeon]